MTTNNAKPRTLTKEERQALSLLQTDLKGVLKSANYGFGNLIMGVVALFFSVLLGFGLIQRYITGEFEGDSFVFLALFCCLLAGSIILLLSVYNSSKYVNSIDNKRFFNSLRLMVKLFCSLPTYNTNELEQQIAKGTKAINLAKTQDMKGFRKDYSLVQFCSQINSVILRELKEENHKLRDKRLSARESLREFAEEN
ncbi:hypothetical protein QTV49_004911 [Vibrio vulnificus]|nr:hypothetical protein [Vibrio vulnificus]